MGSEVHEPVGPTEAASPSYDVAPEAVQPSGDEPSEDASNEPFRTLLPRIVTVRVPALFSSSDSATSSVRSAVIRIVCSPVAPRVSQPTETVADSPAGIAGVSTTPRTVAPSRRNSVLEAGASPSPVLATVAVTVTLSPYLGRLFDAVASETTRSGARSTITGMCTRESHGSR